ncbi:MAG: antibiotic transport system ATP-binding protein [Halanaerobium sp. 4-GBenrich]|jgi:ABC-2 type transport system ATP-binding protein|uniref:ABC-2 type transport system ATP-binding protein n=1 Tax=Halanaerobium congolense TaxID=54121 RepID=A0A1G6QWX5_9FIRM|nr:ABC transporter ATP-binding protein [Halanaerobium congolense]KXS48953.1 MAG: antibiotic transport system ATP-binding protein [Halanaerobium sp. T82-1]ODS50433.1 MAG: antibiotic transport system ATP-binding protein [Halanaerobium sp. 4-GBenrich]PUU91679.1 MAG: antibiotic transport system ATP-binding protein [Halanaerobium sp.]PTX15984.1 ABC-2 type transport system ATP-binding protein [Halanaerobium congolense]PXV64188.1 ABC-2 type transport system ATP-binding protein [Halanaerobium congolen
MSTAIKIRNTNKSYGHLQALSDINLDIKKGEFFGLLGPNGAGKSTLIGVLGGLVKKDSGSITVLGKDIISNYRETKKSLGIVPQEITFDPYFTVRETLKIHSGYFGIKDNSEKIDELLEALSLTDKAEIGPRELSGGMKRRLLIAKALVHDPEIIVLDEPTAGVDVELRNSLWEYVINLNKQGKTIILTTHYLEEAEALCDRIAIMNKGKIVKVDTKENLINSIDKKLIKIQFADSVHGLNKELLGIDFNLNKEKKEIEIETAKGNLDKILKTINDLNLDIVDMNIESAKLEDVFIKLTNLGDDEN